jgi:hypothetical protein
MSIATSNPGRTIALEALRPDATAGDKRSEAALQHLVQSLAGSVINPAYLLGACNTSQQGPTSAPGDKRRCGTSFFKHWRTHHPKMLAELQS